MKTVSAGSFSPPARHDDFTASRENFHGVAVLDPEFFGEQRMQFAQRLGY